MNIINNSDNNNNMNIKLFTLDPLSVIIKLALLKYKSIGTKIDIKNNIITFHSPGIFQFIYRYVNNSSKTELHYLYNPIYIACKTYLNKNEHEKKNIEYDRLKKLFEIANGGLKNLIDTYKNCSMITVCLNYYYSLISNFISNKSSNHLFQKDNMTSLYTNELINKLSLSWTSDKIKVVLDLFDYINTNNHDLCESNISSLEKLMEKIDTDTQAIIYNI